MSRAGLISVALILTAATVTGLISGTSTSAAPLAGAIFTTTPDGAIVNENVRYTAKSEVYLDGGPGPNAPRDAAGLPDGNFVFQVTNPNGAVLLSEDTSRCRAVRLEGGVIVARLDLTLSPDGTVASATDHTKTDADDACHVTDPPDGAAGVSEQHDTNTDTDHGGAPAAGDNAIVVQLMPFFDTPNNGGVYKAWIMPINSYLANGGDLDAVPEPACNRNGRPANNCGNPNAVQIGFEGDDGFGPPRDQVKTDNFKVREFQSFLNVQKFHDLNQNGQWDEDEPAIGPVTGLHQCVTATGQIDDCVDEGGTGGGWPVTITDQSTGVANTFFTPAEQLPSPAGTYSITEDTFAPKWKQTVVIVDGEKQVAITDTVKVTVEGFDGEKHSVIFGNCLLPCKQPPVVDFNFSPTDPTAGKPVKFSAKISGGTLPYICAWDVGKDGSIEGTNCASFTHIFPTKGSFSVDLTVTDANDAVVRVNKKVTVLQQPLVVDFNFSPTDPTAGKPVKFSAKISGGTPPYICAWDVGKDGSIEGTNCDNFSQTFFPGDPFASGSFSVVLTVTDANGKVISVNKTVTVRSQPTPTPTPTATPDQPWLEKLPPLANLWLCTQPIASCEDNPKQGINVVNYEFALGRGIKSFSPKDGTLQTLGSFEFEVRYDSKYVTVEVGPGPLTDFNGDGIFNEMSCLTARTESSVRLACFTLGKPENAPSGPGVLAIVTVRATPVNFSILRARQQNGITTQIINQDCQLSDLQGDPIKLFGEIEPGVGAGVCKNGAVTIRFLEGDVHNDCVVDSMDAQQLAFRWGAIVGDALYNDRFDLEPGFPSHGDGDIDGRDIQFVLGRHVSTCKAPHPPQPPVDPKAKVPPPLATSTPVPPPQKLPAGEEQVVTDSRGCSYAIQFLGAFVNDTDHDWSYQVTSLLFGAGVCGVSNWALEFCPKAFDAYLDSRPGPSSQIVADPDTGLTGVKWDGLGGGAFAFGTFTVTLSQNLSAGLVPFGLTTVEGTVPGTIEGPMC